MAPLHLHIHATRSLLSEDASNGTDWSSILTFLVVAQCAFGIGWYLRPKKTHGMAAVGDVSMSASDEALLERLRNRDYVADVSYFNQNDATFLSHESQQCVR